MIRKIICLFINKYGNILETHTNMILLQERTDLWFLHILTYVFSKITLYTDKYIRRAFGYSWCREVKMHSLADMIKYVHLCMCVCVYLCIKEESFQFVLESWLESSSSSTHPLHVAIRPTSIHMYIHAYFTHTHTCASEPAVQCNSLEFRLDKRLRRTCAAAADANANVHAHARWPWPSIRASSLSRAEKSGAERKRLNAMRMQRADWRNLLPSAAKADGDAVKLKFCPQTAASVAPSNSHTHKHARMYAHVFIYRYVCVCVACKFSPLAAHGDDCTLP